eukprot:GSA25T00004930001.1
MLIGFPRGRRFAADSVWKMGIIFCEVLLHISAREQAHHAADMEGLRTVSVDARVPSFTASEDP